MAKSSSFFTLRSGSTKSLTFQTYHGKQVTKDRVTKVSNPQSTAQMEQRLRLPIIARYRSALKGLVDHSFQSVDYGWKSLQHFSSINLQRGQVIMSQYVPKGINQMGVAQITVSQGSLPPTEVVINDGSKIQVTDLTIALNTAVDTSSATTADAKKRLVAESLISQILSANPQLKEGDQITILVQLMTNTGIYAVGDEQLTYPVSEFAISRLRLDADELANSQWINKLNITDSSTTIQAPDGLSDGVFTLTPNTTVGTDIAYSGSAVRSGITKPILAGCVILSRQTNNVWQRSTQDLVSSDNMDIEPSLTFDAVLPTYLKSAAASAKYLNKGNDPTYITGDDTDDTSDSSSTGKVQG